MDRTIDLSELIETRGMSDEKRLVTEFVRGVSNENMFTILDVEDRIDTEISKKTKRVCELLRLRKRSKVKKIKDSKLTTIGIKFINLFEIRALRAMKRLKMNVTLNSCSIMDRSETMRGCPDILLKKRVGRNTERSIVIPIEVKSSKYFRNRHSFEKYLKMKGSKIRKEKDGGMKVKEDTDWHRQVVLYSKLLGVRFGILAIRVASQLIQIRVDVADQVHEHGDCSRGGPSAGCENRLSRPQNISGNGVPNDQLRPVSSTF